MPKFKNKSNKEYSITVTEEINQEHLNLSDKAIAIYDLLKNLKITKNKSTKEVNINFTPTQRKFIEGLGEELVKKILEKNHEDSVGLNKNNFEKQFDLSVFKICKNLDTLLKDNSLFKIRNLRKFKSKKEELIQQVGSILNKKRDEILNDFENIQQAESKSQSKFSNIGEEKDNFFVKERQGNPIVAHLNHRQLKESEPNGEKRLFVNNGKDIRLNSALDERLGFYGEILNRAVYSGQKIRETKNPERLAKNATLEELKKQPEIKTFFEIITKEVLKDLNRDTSWKDKGLLYLFAKDKVKEGNLTENAIKEILNSFLFACIAKANNLQIDIPIEKISDNLGKVLMNATTDLNSNMLALYAEYLDNNFKHLLESYPELNQTSIFYEITNTTDEEENTKDDESEISSLSLNEADRNAVLDALNESVSSRSNLSEFLNDSTIHDHADAKKNDPEKFTSPKIASRSQSRSEVNFFTKKPIQEEKELVAPQINPKNVKPTSKQESVPNSLKISEKDYNKIKNNLDKIAPVVSKNKKSPLMYSKYGKKFENTDEGDKKFQAKVKERLESREMLRNIFSLVYDDRFWRLDLASRTPDSEYGLPKGVKDMREIFRKNKIETLSDITRVKNCEAIINKCKIIATKYFDKSYFENDAKAATQTNKVSNTSFFMAAANNSKRNTLLLNGFYAAVANDQIVDFMKNAKTPMGDLKIKNIQKYKMEDWSHHRDLWLEMQASNYYDKLVGQQLKPKKPR